jgi:hypothetical protein
MAQLDGLENRSSPAYSKLHSSIGPPFVKQRIYAPRLDRVKTGSGALD